MVSISNLSKSKLLRLLRFGIATSLIFSLIFYIDTNKFFPTQMLDGFLFGVLIGILEEIASSRKFVSLSTPLQVFLKTLGIIICIAILSLFVIYKLSVIKQIEFTHLLHYWDNKRFTSSVLSAFLVAFGVSTYFQIEKLVGKNMLVNYLKGRYRHPKKEVRVFLFLDLKGSTTLSEKLGNDTYYSFLNDSIYMMSEAIITTKAEIYQYVGDEVVFSWPLEKGIANNNCLRLFEKVNNAIEKNKSYFLKHYGYVPEFKGAMHAGIVLAAEIGHIKKDIVYSGDVLNTTSRMESLCNGLNAKLLISKSLFNLLDRKHEILYEELGPVELKGKDETIELIKVHPPNRQFDQERKQLEKVLHHKS